MRFDIKGARLAFPNIYTPKESTDGGKAKYNCSLIIPPDHPIIPELDKAFEKIALDKWGKNGAAILAGLRKQDRLCLHDGDTKASYDGFAGNMFISASSDSQPSIRNRAGEHVQAGKDQAPYGGCYVLGKIELWPQDHQKHGKRINAQIRGVQFMRDGDAFSAGRPASDDEFESLEVEEEVDPLS